MACARQPGSILQMQNLGGSSCTVYCVPAVIGVTSQERETFRKCPVLAESKCDLLIRVGCQGTPLNRFKFCKEGRAAHLWRLKWVKWLITHLRLGKSVEPRVKGLPQKLSASM